MLALPILLSLIAALATLLCSQPAIQRRLGIIRLGWLAAVAPLASFAWLLSRTSEITSGGVIVERFTWLPSLSLNTVLYFDGLSALFALLVSGIGGLIMIYSGYYFSQEPNAWRFLTYMLLFLASMLGLVLAGDLITLFVFWEATSLTSYLLVAYKYKDEKARRGAQMALLVTAGGGVALLLGFLLVTSTAGSSEFSVILQSGELLRSSPLYPAILLFIALGAFTKSAQVPFHFWLPNAMSAPTPASAFLHSATMVKAGIYLLARLNPSLGMTDLWFWVLSLIGLATMLTGAYLGLKQNDLKALLAYSTISQLGVLVMLIGQDTSIAFKALAIGLTAHALYKSALFMITGIVDQSTGTRDLRFLGGLWRAMPVSSALGSLAALSMAGLPPMFGFLAKETLLATVTHPSLPQAADWILTTGVVVSGSLILAQAGLFVVGTFLGQRKSEVLTVHKTPLWMWLAPAIPTLISFLLSSLPEPKPVASLLASAAASAYGDKVKVSLALWNGLTVELLLSALAVSLGLLLFLFREPLRRWQQGIASRLGFERAYEGLLSGVDRLASWVTRLQNGRLRYYLAVLLSTTFILLALFGGLSLELPELYLPALDFSEELAALRLFALLLTVAAAAITILLRQDLLAILALGASGLSVAVLMILEPAPDVALVQLIVDTLLTVILVLALTRLPRVHRQRAEEFTYRQARGGLLRDGLIAIGAGTGIFILTLNALTARPRASLVTPFYMDNAKPLTGARDVVGAIITDFRGFDTLVEISVFAMAGMGVFTLLRYASRKAGDRDLSEPHPSGQMLLTRGIGGVNPSPFLRLLAALALPVALIVALTHLFYGHDQPGDGFTAGVIIGLGVSFWYVIFGYQETHQRLYWLRPPLLIGSGLTAAIVNALMPVLSGQTLFSHLDYGKLLGLRLPDGVSLTTSFFFEAAICLSVLGGVIAILDALGHPKDDDPEDLRQLEEMGK